MIFRFLPILVAMACGTASLRGQLTLIEENFDEALPGAVLTAVEGGDKQAGIRPTYGEYSAFTRDHAEIVSGFSGEGQALQFQDKIKDATLRFVFSVDDVDPVTSGTLEVSMDFRVESQQPLGPGTTLIVKLGAPTMGLFLTVVLSDEGLILHTNGSTPPAYRGMTRGQKIQPGVVYTLTITANLDTSTYDIVVAEKGLADEGIVWSATGQKFIPIPDLESNGLGKQLLDISVGSPDFSQGVDPPVTVTIDNILVRHLD